MIEICDLPSTVCDNCIYAANGKVERGLIPTESLPNMSKNNYFLKFTF